MILGPQKRDFGRYVLVEADIGIPKHQEDAQHEYLRDVFILSEIQQSYPLTATVQTHWVSSLGSPKAEKLRHDVFRSWRHGSKGFSGIDKDCAAAPTSFEIMP